MRFTTSMNRFPYYLYVNSNNQSKWFEFYHGVKRNRYSIYSHPYPEKGFVIPRGHPSGRASKTSKEFIEECLEPKAGATLQASFAYSSYQSWCARCGYKEMSFRNFNRDMERHADVYHSKHGAAIRGYAIRFGDSGAAEYGYGDER